MVDLFCFSVGLDFKGKTAVLVDKDLSFALVCVNDASLKKVSEGVSGG